MTVIRTVIFPERIFVPPVTPHRSPPDSLITGADSPVMADSSTRAVPSMMSPSPGIYSPSSTSNDVAFHKVPRRHLFRAAVTFTSGATSWFRVLLSDSALAFPRISASASAKFANKTVTHSQMLTWRLRA